MTILYVCGILLLFILAILFIGIMSFNEQVKKYTMTVASVIYNGFIGYIDTIVLLIIYGFFTNRPNGSGYDVPKTEFAFNVFIGIIILIIYLVLLIPINIYMKKKGKIDSKAYTIVSLIATAFGAIIFWIFLDKGQILF